jgi:hypothetical protein
MNSVILRPTAIAEGWLEGLGFTASELQPMSSTGGPVGRAVWRRRPHPVRPGTMTARRARLKFENRGTERAGVLNVSAPGNFEQHMPGIAQWFAEHPPGDTRL